VFGWRLSTKALCEINRDPGVVRYHEPATIRRLVLMLREMSEQTLPPQGN
jgi:hypothetical protein